ncbi:MAG: alpha/beta fold hydrolase [Candidatus Didemnitutus sp.]|nr:alpha/beta fold hydrolase [Candidatus Didemnitutus sp.]
MRRATLALLLLVMAASPASAVEPEPECVVLLHGVAMSGWVMRPLERALSRAGYRVINLSYPSRRTPLEQVADEFLPAELKRRGALAAPRLHFVTHSMGGIVTRLYLRDHRPANLGRVVMLGPPNHGSPAADRAGRSPWMRTIMGVNMPRLGTGPDGVVRTLGPADYELGVIAGTRLINPLFRGVMPRPHDGVVTVESAKLEGMRDFRAVPYSHTGMLWRRPVIDAALAFLRTGRFQPALPEHLSPSK